MSLTQIVFLSSANAPSAKAWVRAIRERGFPFTMDGDFDLETHSGFLPCHLDQERDGFEYEWSRIEDGEFDARVRRKIKTFDTAVTFSTGSSALGFDFALAASSVLAEMTGGLYFNDESGDFFRAADIIKIALKTNWGPIVPEPTPVVSVPERVDVNIEGRVVFWGEHVIMLETLEAVPKRCTLRMSTATVRRVERVNVCSVWQTKGFETTVGAVNLGETTVWLDSIGALVAAPHEDRARR